MAAQNHPKYSEWKASLERLLAAQDHLDEALAREAAAAAADQAEALAAYQKITDGL